MSKVGKKIISLLLILAFFLPTLSLAANIYDLPTPRLDSSSSLYFLKIWWEKIQLFFAFLPSWKANLHLAFAENRLAEMNKLAERNIFSYNEQLKKNYNDHLAKVEEILQGEIEKGRKVEELLEKFQDHLTRHEAILLRVLEKAPTEAKDALRQALENSRRGQIKASEMIQKLKEKIK